MVELDGDGVYGTSLRLKLQISVTNLVCLGQAKNMGTHIPGRAAECVKDGLIPVKFETFRKMLGMS